MERKSVRLSENSVELEAPLLSDASDPKAYILDRLPSILDRSCQLIEDRILKEFKSGKLLSANHADDRAIEIAGEVSHDLRMDPVGAYFDALLEQAFKMSAVLRPLLNNSTESVLIGPVTLFP